MGEVNRHMTFGLKSSKKKITCFGDLGVDGSIILKWILKKQIVTEWIHLAQDMDGNGSVKAGEFFE
jgi:hypothetical protein